MAAKDPDEDLVPLFKYIPKLDEIRTREEGRPIFVDEECVEIRSPAAKDVKVFPAHAMARWVRDWETGFQHTQTYAERFKHQYRQFKEKEAQTKVGTPLEYVMFLSEARRAELRHFNIYTVEALANIEGSELKNLGIGGRDLKNLATEYIADSKRGAGDMQAKAQLEAAMARIAVLEDDLQAKQEREKEEGDFAGMTNEQIREFIATHTGIAPQGNSGRKSLIRMAQGCRPERANTA